MFIDFSPVLLILLALAAAIPLGAFAVLQAARGSAAGRLFAGVLGAFVAIGGASFLYLLRRNPDPFLRGAMIGATLLGIGMIVAAFRLRPQAAGDSGRDDR
ncbi:MAG TPA: hypothetical protein PKW35_19125 [Nannocystaceae bacterium]|nr:hypothetical protein [Nannocystaceae bacterium]